MKGKRGKLVFSGVGEWVPMGGGWAQVKGQWGRICWMYFVSIYENRRIKPVEIVLRCQK
jgi:hypothetical protein